MPGQRVFIDTLRAFLDPKPELSQIAAIVLDLDSSGREVRIDVNNHYEGSAPESIERLKGFLLSQL